MYKILDKHGNTVAVTADIAYVKTQTNGLTVRTQQADATAVYASDNDTFYPIKGAVEVYTVQETETASADILRKQAYAIDKIVDIGTGDILTVDEANMLWSQYTAEGMTGEEMTLLSQLIHTAKESIRAQYPDTEQTKAISLANLQMAVDKQGQIPVADLSELQADKAVK